MDGKIPKNSCDGMDTAIDGVDGGSSLSPSGVPRPIPVESVPPDTKPMTTETKKNIIVFQNEQNFSLVEVLEEKEHKEEDRVRVTTALCLNVEPKACSRVVKELSATLPLEDGLSHLKRVRRRVLPMPSSLPEAKPALETETSQATKSTTTTSTKTNHQHTKEGNPSFPVKKEEGETGAKSKAAAETLSSSSGQKRPKKRRKKSSSKQNFVLEILIGTRSHLVQRSKQQNPSSELSLTKVHPIVREFGPLYEVVVPKYEPRSEQEWKEHNQSWPTHYYPLKFDEHLQHIQQQQSALSQHEIDDMRELMERCIATRSVLIVDPNHESRNRKESAAASDAIHAANEKKRQNKTASDHCTIGIIENDNNRYNNDRRRVEAGIVSISTNEQELQGANQQKFHNPLATPVLFAIQGVSRREREATAGIQSSDKDVAEGSRNDAYSKMKVRAIAEQQLDTAISAGSTPTTDDLPAAAASGRHNSYPLGTRLKKFFAKQRAWYLGTIVSYDTESRFYFIKYDDGDTEELEHHEIDTNLSDLPTSKYEEGFQYETRKTYKTKKRKTRGNSKAHADLVCWVIGTVKSRYFYTPKKAKGFWCYRVVLEGLKGDITQDVDEEFITRSIEDAKSKKGHLAHLGSPLSVATSEPSHAKPEFTISNGGTGRDQPQDATKTNADHDHGDNQQELPTGGGKELGEKSEKPKQEQTKGQYICTGYDMYSFYEPSVFEAMACLHSRLRRLIYFVPSKGSDIQPTANNAVWSRGISRHGVHHLPGTNHSYRAFEYRRSSFSC